MTTKQVESENTVKKTQEELNNEIKAKAVKAEFTKINSGEWTNKEVYIEGEISFEPINDEILSEMLVTVEEDEGFGVYTVLIIDRSNIDKLLNGTKIRVYGKCRKDETTGMPALSGNVIEFL